MFSVMVDQIASEQSALNEEITDFRAIVAILSNQPAPTTEQQQGTQTMQAMPKWLINWKTTLSGVIAVAAQVAKVVPALQQYSPILDSLSGVAAGFGLISAKDSNVTGGTVSNVSGVAGKPVSLIDGK
jgi:hypothetical protein